MVGGEERRTKLSVVQSPYPRIVSDSVEQRLDVEIQRLSAAFELHNDTITKRVQSLEAHNYGAPMGLQWGKWGNII